MTLSEVLSRLPRPRHDRVGAVRVRVKGGFEPDTIVARAGEPLRIVFRREETAPCSEGVVFPDLGRSATLPPWRDVSVEFMPEEPGEHEFTCQFGLLRGRLIVLQNGTLDERK